MTVTSPPQPLSTPRTSAIAAVVVLGSVMTVLDVTIVNVALDHLSRSFDAPLTTIQWVATGYTLALATIIPVTAWAIARFGAKRLYLFSLGLFAVGSALAGAAWNIESLIAFRVVQGLGGGMIMPIGMTIVIGAAPAERRGRMMGVLGIPVLIGPLAGPILGGWLVDDVSWRWIFLINPPIAAVAILLGARILPRSAPGEARTLDVPGLLMLSPGLALLIYGLATGGEKGDFTAPGTLLPAIIGAALVTGFLLRAFTARHPLVDLRLFRDRTFAAATGTLVLFTAAYFGSMLLLPLYYQLLRGESATTAGLLGAPAALVTGLSMQIASRLADRLDPGRVVLAGTALASTGFLIFTTQVGADTPYWRLVLPLCLMAAGVGSTIMPAMTAATRHLSPAQIPHATATINIISQLASTAGTAFLSTLLASTLVTPAGKGISAVHALPDDLRRSLAPPLADAFQHTYLWAVALMLLATVPAYLLKRRR